MYREPVAIDTETHLFTDLVPIPKLVCASIANRDPRASGNPIISDLKTGKDFKEQLISLLKNDNVLILAHNAKFDMAVFSVAYGFEVAKLIHLKYKKHLILCTMLNEKQLRLQSDGILPKASKGKTSEFSLEFCIKKWLGLDTNKSKDVWRKRYSELEHLPISKYPVAAREYAIKDAVYCLRVFEQQGLANKVDIFDQCHSDWLCQMSNIFGMTVDNEFLEGRYKPLEKMIKSHEYILRKTKIKQVKKNNRTAYLQFLSQYYTPKMKLKGSLDDKIKFYEEKMELAGYDVIKESLKFELPFGQNKFRVQKLISRVCQKLEITPKLTKSAKNMDVDSITDEGFIKKIAVDDESLAAVEGFHKGLDAIKELGNANKVVSTYLNNWRGKEKIFPSIDILLTTGRVSCVAAWTKIKTIDGFKEIKDIKEGDLVLTHKNRYRKVMGTKISKKQPMFNITFCNGEVLTCTISHRLLQSNGEWITIKEILNECIERVDKQQGECRENIGTIPRQKMLHYYSDTRNDGYNNTEHNRGIQKIFRPTRVQGFKKIEVFSFKNRIKESYVRESGQSTSQLERSSRRWVRLPSLHKKQQNRIRSQISYDGFSRCDKITERNGCTSYRQQSNEQQDRQFSFVYKEGASPHSFFSEQGKQFVTLKEINCCGDFEVYDIAVEHDHSYLACGVFNHNCYKPNLQNIPRKGRVRGCFVPENQNTHYLCSIDFGQIELCTLAQVMIWQGIGSEMADAINAKKDLHCMTGATLLNMSYEEFYAGYKADDPIICGARALAKVVNFGGFGGMGKVTFKNQARKQGINLTLQESERALLALKKTFPAQKYFNHRKVEKVHTEFGEMYKCLQLPTDRVRMISVKGFEEKGGYCAANNTYFQALAADTMKKADRLIKEQCWFEENKLMNDVNPLLTVHDEWLGEIPIKTAHDSAFAVTKIMLDTAYKMLPDIKVIKAEPCLMKRWEKEAKPVYDKNGKLIVWEFEKHGKSA